MEEDKVKLFMAIQLKSGLLVLTIFLGWIASGSAQTLPPTSVASQQPQGQASASQSLTGPQPADPQSPGCISGTVVDQSGAVVAGAQIKLVRPDQSQNQQVVSTEGGQFFFANVPPGPFTLTITSSGFATQVSSGTLRAGDLQTIPQIVLDVATDITQVQVGVTAAEVAEDEVKVEEKQRVLGVVPNFYVTYDPHPVALSSKQKFNLAWKTVIDPFTFVVVAGASGVEQAQNHFVGYGQGTEGYAKRFGASYADTVAGVYIGGAILPSLLKQDPRYFYKGTGSTSSRALYAVANSVICKGDNGHWQPGYSNIIGSFAAGAISNIYYPAQDRNGASLTFENGAIALASTAVGNLLQEFLIKKLTPKVPHDAAKQ